MENKFGVFGVFVLVDTVYSHCFNFVDDDFFEPFDRSAFNEFQKNFRFENLNEGGRAVFLEFRELGIYSFKFSSQRSEKFSEFFVFSFDLSYPEFGSSQIHPAVNGY